MATFVPSAPYTLQSREETLAGISCNAEIAQEEIHVAFISHDYTNHKSGIKALPARSVNARAQTFGNGVGDANKILEIFPDK